MTTQPTTETCGAARDVLPCVLDADHGGAYHQDVNGYRWPTAAAMQQAAEDLRPAGMAALLAHVAANLPDEDQPTHEGPDPSHGGLTTHRGRREDCTGPDCTGPDRGPAPTAPSTATAALYEAMRRIADAPQNYELDPGRGDSRAIIRTLLAEIEAQAQPGPSAPADDDHARRLADQITALGKARGWSTWAADFIHPDREFVDPGAPDEDPCHPCGCPKRFNRHADGCPAEAQQ